MRDVDGTGLQEIEDKNLAQKIRDKAGEESRLSTRLFSTHRLFQARVLGFGFVVCGLGFRV